MIPILFAVIFVGISKVSIAKLSATASYETLNVTVPKPFVYHVELNRANKLNALNRIMWL